MSLMNEKMSDMKHDLERISRLGTFQQVGEIWPVVWKMWALLAVMVEKIEGIEHGK